MTIDEILHYILTTPWNTNATILHAMIRAYSPQATAASINSVVDYVLRNETCLNEFVVRQLLRDLGGVVPPVPTSAVHKFEWVGTALGKTQLGDTGFYRLTPTVPDTPTDLIGGTFDEYVYQDGDHHNICTIDSVYQDETTGFYIIDSATVQAQFPILILLPNDITEPYVAPKGIYGLYESQEEPYSTRWIQSLEWTGSPAAPEPTQIITWDGDDTGKAVYGLYGIQMVHVTDTVPSNIYNLMEATGYIQNQDASIKMPLYVDGFMTTEGQPIYLLCSSDPLGDMEVYMVVMQDTLLEEQQLYKGIYFLDLQSMEDAAYVSQLAWKE